MYVDVAFKGALQHEKLVPHAFSAAMSKSQTTRLMPRLFEAVAAVSTTRRTWRKKLAAFFAPFKAAALHSQQTADSSERSKKHIIAFFRCRENQSVQPYFRTEMNAFVHCFFTTAANSKILCSIWSIRERGKVGEASRWKDEKNYFAQYT